MKLTELLLLFSSLVLTFLGFFIYGYLARIKRGAKCPLFKEWKALLQPNFSFIELLLSFDNTRASNYY